MASDVTQGLRKRRASEASWREWFRLVYPRVFYAVYRLTGGDSAQSEDLTQTAIERFLRYSALDRVATDREAVAYLISTARRLHADSGRRDSTRQVVGLAESAARVQAESDVADDALEALSLERLTDRLAREDRELIRWWCEGRSVSDIATSLGIRYTAAATRIHRAKLRLKALAEDA